MKRHQATFVLLSLSLTLGACDDPESSSVEKDRSSRSKKKKKSKSDADTDSSSTAAPPVPVAPANPDEVVQAFWREQIAACNAYNEKVGNTTPPDKYFTGDASDPSRSITVVQRVSPEMALIEDAGGNRLVAMVANKKIMSPAGKDSALPHVYSFCDPAVWLGTTDEGVVDPEPVAPAPSPAPAPAPASGGSNSGGLAADGLPVVIPEMGSPVPKPQDFDAQPREITVRRSGTLKCETKMVREWMQVRCFANDLGSPHAIDIVRAGGVQAYKFEAPGERITLVIQIARGRQSRVVFKWNTGRGYTSDVALVTNWPGGAPRPSLYFEGS